MVVNNGRDSGWSMHGRDRDAGGGRSSRQIDESISIADFFPPNRSRFLLPISSRQIDESISIADFFIFNLQFN
jgi:hypothetical protein